MKKLVFLLGLMLAATAGWPELGFAKLPLDMPPILAKKDVCTAENCPSGFCCGGTCYTTGNCCNGIYCAGAYCCDGTTCSTTACPECTETTPCGAGSFCCGGTCYTTGDCCNGTYSTTACPVGGGGFNDTGIVSKKTDYDDSQYGRDKAAQDGTLQKTGAGIAGFDFSNTESGGCVKDNVTGLTWSPDKGLDWWDNLGGIATTANNDNLCGSATWRLPTLKELLSIVSYHTASAATVDTTFFSTIQKDWYWTQTSYVPASNTAWGVSFSTGSAFSLAKGVLTADKHRVILVHE
jgi:hypothetical protein